MGVKSGERGRGDEGRAGVTCLEWHLDVEEHEVVWPAVHAAIGQPGGRLGVVGRIMHARLQASGEQLRRRADEHGAQCGQPVLGDAERGQDKVLEKVRVEAATDGVVVDDEHAAERGGQF